MTRYFLKAFFSIASQGAEKSAYPLTCETQGGFLAELCICNFEGMGAL